MQAIYATERAAGEVDEVNMIDEPRRQKKTARKAPQAAPRPKKGGRTPLRRPLVDPEHDASVYLSQMSTGELQVGDIVNVAVDGYDEEAEFEWRRDPLGVG